jgi:hypothetical protein
MTTQVLPIDSLMKEVSALIERELYQMLDKYMKNYKKYKKTYKHIMKLPVVRKLKDFKNTKEGSKGNKGIIHMLINQINELTAEVSTLKTALYNYEHENDECREQENISLNITEPNVEDLVPDTGTKVYAELIESTQPQQTNSNITQTKVVKLDAPAVVSEAEEEDGEEEEVVDEEEEVVDEEEEVVDEEEEVVDEEEDEEEVFEIEIDDKTYYTNNEENGIIYEALPNDEVGEKIGYLKDGEPFFTNIV